MNLLPLQVPPVILTVTRFGLSHGSQLILKTKLVGGILGAGREREELFAISYLGCCLGKGSLSLIPLSKTDYVESTWLLQIQKRT